MRSRKKKWAPLFLEEHKDCFFDASRENTYDKVYLEIGMGKGDFLLQNALANKDVLYIGVEIDMSICAIALKKFINNNLENYKVLCCDAKTLNELIKDHSIDRLYLNFSDPWPKARHDKRRLTHNSFLNVYQKLLKDNGLVILKTDNQNLYQFTLEQVALSKMSILSKDENYILENGDYLTEYESRFRSLNLPIYRIIIQNGVNNE